MAVIVYVFPDPVWPYAKHVRLPPASTYLQHTHTHTHTHTHIHARTHTSRQQAGVIALTNPNRNLYWKSHPHTGWHSAPTHIHLWAGVHTNTRTAASRAARIGTLEQSLLPRGTLGRTQTWSS